jgi:tRNA threonylcarbamoyl adenosine modification protein YeaZ
MLVLGIDTSSEVVVSSLYDGRGVLGSSTQPGAQAHGELLAPGIEAMLARAARRPRDLTHIVVGVGPGPFTGLRVGIATALVMGEALGIPVLGVCSLDVVALAASAPGGATAAFCVVTDARRKEVYVARYDVDRRRIGEPFVARPADLDDDVRRGQVVGVGAALYADQFADVRSTAALDPTSLAAASGAVVRGSDHVTSLPPHPLYLRRPDAVASATRKRVTPS